MTVLTDPQKRGLVAFHPRTLEAWGSNYTSRRGHQVHARAINGLRALGLVTRTERFIAAVPSWRLTEAGQAVLAEIDPHVFLDGTDGDLECSHCGGGPDSVAHYPGSVIE